MGSGAVFAHDQRHNHGVGGSGRIEALVQVGVLLLRTGLVHDTSDGCGTADCDGGTANPFGGAKIIHDLDRDTILRNSGEDIGWAGRIASGGSVGHGDGGGAGAEVLAAYTSAVAIVVFHYQRQNGSCATGRETVVNTIGGGSRNSRVHVADHTSQCAGGGGDFD